MVSEYEEREAARFGLYTWAQWQVLPRHERVMSMAHYRLHHIVELVGQDTVQEHTERQIESAKKR